MSEQEVQSEPEVEAEVETEEPEAQPEKKLGTEKLDFNELPEQLRDKFEARFKRVYGHMKEYERTVTTLAQDQKALIEKLEKIEGGQIQDRTQRRIESLNAQAQAAIEQGDVDGAKRIQEQISEFVNQSIEDARKPKEQPRPPEAYIPPEAEATLVGWANEITDDGNFKRPWAQPSHGRYQDAIAIAQEIYDQRRGEPLEDILGDIDRQVSARLFPKKPARAQSVLDADQSITPKAGKGTSLSDSQKAVARMMYSHLPPKEAEARYAKAMKEV